MQKVDHITIAELHKMAETMYGNLVKAVVDISQKILVVDAEMHADEEDLLLKAGSKQTDLWGINLYPAKFGTDEFIEFDSMINIRPRQNNMSRDIANEGVRAQIIAIVREKVTQ